MEKSKLNFKINKKEKLAIISVNPKIYPLEVIYSAGYVFLDRAYVILDGDPEKEIFIKLIAKSKQEDIEKLALDFNNELLNYAVYVVQAARTSGIRQAIVERALFTVENLPKKEEEDEDEIEDPLGIAKPWTPESAKGIKLPADLEEENEK
ncbi:MAG: hypothetical protein QXO21_03030 [Candidatus Anstonellales archaeon]